MSRGTSGISPGASPVQEPGPNWPRNCRTFFRSATFSSFESLTRQAKIPVIVFQHGVEINIGAVLRPGQVAKEVRGGVQLAPLFGLHVVEHQFVVPGGDRNDVAAIRRPAGSEDLVAAQQVRKLASLEVEQLNECVLGSQASIAKGERVPVRWPGGIRF